MMPQKEELIYFNISGIEIFDIAISLVYVAAAITMFVISFKSSMSVPLKIITTIASFTSCVFAIRKLISFLKVFEYLHFITNLFDHPWGVKKLTLYQSVLAFQVNTFSLTATLILVIPLIATIIHGYPKS